MFNYCLSRWLVNNIYPDNSDYSDDKHPEFITIYPDSISIPMKIQCLVLEIDVLIHDMCWRHFNSRDPASPHTFTHCGGMVKKKISRWLVNSGNQTVSWEFHLSINSLKNIYIYIYIPWILSHSYISPPENIYDMGLSENVGLIFPMK